MATRAMQPTRATPRTYQSKMDPMLFDIDTSPPSSRLSVSSTLALAEFLASTGPEEFASRASMATTAPPPPPRTAMGGEEYQRPPSSRKQLGLLRKFRTRKYPSGSQTQPPVLSSFSDIVVDHYHHRSAAAASGTTRSGSGHRLTLAPSTTAAGAKHIPLPQYYEPIMRDSGIYSMGGSSGSGGPTPTSSSGHKDTVQCTSSPTTATSPTSPSSQIQADLQLFPMPPPSVPSSRNSAISVSSKHQQHKRLSIFRPPPLAPAAAATTTNRKNAACPHCRQRITGDRKTRRSSCPPALAGGLVDGGKLLERIAQLEAMLMKERLSRKQLEDLVKQHLQQQQQQPPPQEQMPTT